MDPVKQQMTMGGKINPYSKYYHLFVEPNTCSNSSFLVGRKDLGGEQHHDVDTLLANAGYSVKASDLAHVAQRLEQLESVLCAAQEAGISHLSSEAIHYNPSDLAGWIECMIGELAPSVVNNPQQQQQLERASPYTDQGSNSASSMDQQVHAHFKQQEEPMLGTTVSSYGVSCIEELEEFDQFKHGRDDQASSNDISGFYTPYDVPEVHESMALANLQQKPYPHHQPGLLNQEEALSSQLYPPFHDQYTIKYSQNDQNCKVLGTQNHDGQQIVILPDEGRAGPDQECGVRLVHLLMACAQAVQCNQLKLAHEMVNEIQSLAYPQTNGAMAKVAAYFVEALARRIYGLNSLQDWKQQQADGYSDLLYYHFYETCPYLKFAHFTANQAILEAFEGEKFVHVIDFNLMQGLQWPALIQALALRPGGPPHLRLTGIGPPQPDNKDLLQEIGMKLAQLADSVNVEFDFRGILAAKLDDVEPWMFHVRHGEAVAVNSILQLHRLLPAEKSHAPIDEVLKSVKSLNPKIVTVVEQEADHNGGTFEERFMQALQYYCTMFDSLEACHLPSQSMEVALTEMYLGKEIVNVVACEGRLRLERHETLFQWRKRMASAGFKPSHLGSNAFKQASMLLTLFSGEGYTVQENNGCLTLGWHSRPLIAASAWQCG